MHQREAGRARKKRKSCFLGAVYMGGGTGRLPGRDVCRDGTFYIPGLHENVSTRDDLTRGQFAKSA